MMFFGEIIKQTTERIKDDFVTKFCSTVDFANSRLVLLRVKFGSTDEKMKSDASLQQVIMESSVVRLWIFYKGCITSAIFFMYITIPIRIFSYIWNIGINVVCRRSKHARAGLSHVRSLIAIVFAFWTKFRSTSYARLFEVACEAAAEFLQFMVKSPTPDRVDSSPELSELLAYEELSYEDDPATESRRMKHMHHYVPINPFRATVRLHRRPRSRQQHTAGSTSKPSSYSGLSAATKVPTSGELFYQSLLKYPYVLQNSSSHSSTTNSHADMVMSSSAMAGLDTRGDVGDYFYGDGASLDNEDLVNSQFDVVGTNVNANAIEQHGSSYAASPTSFPSTPFSRAFVMNRSAERVDSVMFAARDWLRLQTQTNSRDAHTRHAALAAQSLRQFAVFDSKQCDEGLALSCGAHCVLKVGSGAWSSVRSMTPITASRCDTPTYCYFEWSITATAGQVPMVALGLSTVEFPLNCEVGFAPRSIGFNSMGLLTTGSASSSFAGLTFGLSACQISAGSTIGFLVRCDNSDNNVTKLNLVVNVNGIILPFSASAQLAIQEECTSLDGSPALFPTVSLQSPNTRVWCRFSEADMVQRTRAAVGAVLGSRVYCLDGTLLIGDVTVTNPN